MGHNISNLLSDYKQTGGPEISAADVIQIWELSRAADPGEMLLRAIVTALQAGYEIGRRERGRNE